MNEYQKVFLFYVFIYYLFKVGIFVACCFVAKLVKQRVQQHHEQTKMAYMKKRAEEQERWKIAYGSYDKQKDASTLETPELPKLMANPNSFTAYSSVNKGYFKFGMSA